MHARPRQLAFVPIVLVCAFALTAVVGCTDRHPLEFTPTSLADAQVGSAYSATITVTQAATPVGGVSVQNGTLPAGLELALNGTHDNTIKLSGTPTASGTFTFSVSVWCLGTNVSGQTATQPYTLTVK